MILSPSEIMHSTLSYKDPFGFKLLYAKCKRFPWNICIRTFFVATKLFNEISDDRDSVDPILVM